MGRYKALNIFSRGKILSTENQQALRGDANYEQSLVEGKRSLSDLSTQFL